MTAIYSGSGNTFIICEKMEPIEGVDGLLLAEKSSIADAKMRIFNADGSEAEMCGNGLRCFCHYLAEKTGRTTFTIDTLAGLMSAQVSNEHVTIKTPLPKILSSDFSFLDSGVPHAIFFTEDLKRDPRIENGFCLRNDPRFGPKGANINFAKIEDAQNISTRTFERGLANESVACGTAALAIAFAAHKTKELGTTLYIHPLSKETLTVKIQENALFLTGPVKKQILLESFH
jgi:diaminopimelate epimerase